MKLISTSLQGVYLIELEPVADERGLFARTWCSHESKLHGLNPNVAQCSISFNKLKGTIRGMHYQDEPYSEAKLIRCCAGGIYDVLIDLRRTSPSYCTWFAVELNAANRKMIYAPEGVAHGFQTLTDNAEVFYQISESYRPESARGVRWDDPAFGIKWPMGDPILSPRDRTFPDFIP